MMKKKPAPKWISIGAASAILFTALSGGSAYAASPFGDLNQVPEASKIRALQQAGLVHGSADGQFRPQGTLTNAQAIRLVVDMFDLDLGGLQFVRKPEASDYFPKADDQAWYAEALVIASYNDLDLPKDLDPNAAATRASFVSLLIRAGQNESALPVFKLIPVRITDEASIPDGSSGPMQEALAFGLLELDDQGNIRPNEQLTRAAAADILYRAAVLANVIEEQ
ncbi:S-layer homology domain-containing protein [Saccharibacillus sp. WB 17]|nr:S-layer homology domain-containing protein [Saccharibacillus sp. WB 17]